MSEEVLRTDVDAFMELMKRKGKMTIKEAAKALQVNEKTVEMWTDFLVEERILDTEYKFTTQYIFLNTDTRIGGLGHHGIDTKEDFFAKAKKKGIADKQTKLLWLKYLGLHEAKIKDQFLKKAKTKGLSLEKTSKLWDKYYRYLKT